MRPLAGKAPALQLGLPSPLKTPVLLTLAFTLLTLTARAALSPVDVATAETVKSPHEFSGWVHLGDAHSQIARDRGGDPKSLESAEAAYQKALECNPKSPDALTGLAEVAQSRHDSDKTAKFAAQALGFDAKNAAAHGLLGDLAMDRGDYDEAYNDYQAMMDAKPDLSSWSRGANLLWVTGNGSKAMWLMERAIKAGAPFAENTAWCRAKYAMMLFNDGAYVPAEMVLKPALAADSHNVDILFAAARVAAARQDLKTATAYYQKILEAGVQPEALAALGDLQAVQGDKEAAEKYYGQADAAFVDALAKGKIDPLAAALYYADHDRHLNEAFKIAQENQKTENILDADTVAWVLFKHGDAAPAAEVMERALSRNTADAAMAYHAGMIEAAAGDRPEAMKHFGAALNYSPRFDVLQAPVAVAMLEKLGGGKE